MSKKQNTKYDTYEDKEDAFLSGYADGVENFIDMLITFNAIDEDFLHFILRDFFTKHKKEWKDV